MAQLIVRIPISHVRPPEGYFVATNGRSGASGTIFDPWSMDYAVGASSPLSDDGVLWMRGGTYTPMVAGTVAGASAVNGTAGVAGKGVYTLAVNASSGHPITIRNYPGERVRINGAIHLIGGQASYLTIQGIEIAPTPTTRSFANQAAVDYPALYITATSCKLINNYLHDFSAIDILGTGACELNGNIIGGMGYYTVDTGTNRDYDIYTHNNPGGDILIQRNCFLPSFGGYAIHGYSGSTNHVQDYYIDHNIFLGADVTTESFGGNVTNNHINDNDIALLPAAGVIALRGVNWNDPTIDTEAVEFLRNYLGDVGSGASGIFLRGMKTINVQNNTTVRRNGGCLVSIIPYSAPVSTTFDNNIYYSGDGFSYFNWDGTTYDTIADWRTASGMDASSTFTDGSLPAANKKTVIACSSGKRGFVCVHNWTGGTSETFDLSTLGLTDGSGCRYTNCQNPSEYSDFVYDASNPNLTIPLLAASWSRRLPTAYDSPVTWHSETFPNYGAFLVEQR